MASAKGKHGRWTGAGFLGTLEGLALLPLLPREPVAYLIFVALSAAAACWVCGLAESDYGVHDDPRIVLDEVVGLWTAAALLPRTAGTLAAAFVAFRILDAVKLPPYRWLERLPGGAGVVLDDVGAGVCANLAVRAVMHLWPWLL